MSQDYLLLSDLIAEKTTFAHWTQVSDHCPLGYLFVYGIHFTLQDSFYFFMTPVFFFNKDHRDI